MNSSVNVAEIQRHAVAGKRKVGFDASLTNCTFTKVLTVKFPIDLSRLGMVLCDGTTEMFNRINNIVRRRVFGSREKETGIAAGRP